MFVLLLYCPVHRYCMVAFLSKLWAWKAENNRDFWNFLGSSKFHNNWHMLMCFGWIKFYAAGFPWVPTNYYVEGFPSEFLQLLCCMDAFWPTFMLQGFLVINFYVAGIPSDQLLCCRVSLRSTFMLQGFLLTKFYVAGLPCDQPLCCRVSFRLTFMLQGFRATNLYVAGFPSD